MQHTKHISLFDLRNFLHTSDQKYHRFTTFLTYLSLLFIFIIFQIKIDVLYAKCIVFFFFCSVDFLILDKKSWKEWFNWPEEIKPNVWVWPNKYKELGNPFLKNILFYYLDFFLDLFNKKKKLLYCEFYFYEEF